MHLCGYDKLWCGYKRNTKPPPGYFCLYLLKTVHGIFQLKVYILDIVIKVIFFVIFVSNFI